MKAKSFYCKLVIKACCKCAKKNDIPLGKKKKKRKLFSFRTGREIFTLPRGRARFHALGRVSTCERNFTGRGNARTARKERKERKRGIIGSIYWKVDFPAPRDCSREIREDEEEIRKKEEPPRYLAERKTRERGVCRRKCISVAQPCQVPVLRNSRRTSGECKNPRDV